MNNNPSNKMLTPEVYEKKRKTFLDCAYKAGTAGNLAMKTEYMERVGKLDAEYAEQCRGTLRYEDGTE